MTAALPALSVVIAASDPVPVMRECIAALASQDGPALEIIIAHGSGHDVAPELASQFPSVRLLRVEGARSLPALRGAAMAEARGAVIGILDAWCLVGPRWAATVAREHALHQAPVIGGAVLLDGQQSRSLAAWATYLFDYWEFAAPVADGVVEVLPGNNITYKRHALPDAVTLRRDGFWKAFTNARLQAAGQTLRASRDLTVHLRRPVRLGRFLRSRYHHGRSYAAMRVRDAGTLARLRFAALTPALPLLFLTRQLLGLRSKPGARGWFILCLPLLFAFHASWAWGELHGYLAGSGGSDDEIRT